MSIISKVLSIFRMEKEIISELDRIILNDIESSLSPEVKFLWQKQIESINDAQCIPEIKEVVFYRKKNGRISNDPAYSFPNKTEELLVAKSVIGLPGYSEKLIAKTWAVHGFVTMITYHGDDFESYIEGAAGIPPLPFTIKTKLMADLAHVT